MTATVVVIGVVARGSRGRNFCRADAKKMRVESEEGGRSGKN